MSEMMFAALAAKHHRPTVRWLAGKILRHTRNSVAAGDTAEDCVQEAWAQLLKRGLRDGDIYPGLLMKAAMRAYGETLRRRRVESRYQPHLRPLSEDVEPGWGAALTEEGAAAVREADERDARPASLSRGRASRAKPREVFACLMCGASLERMRTTARFCSHACRLRAARRAAA